MEISGFKQEKITVKKDSKRPEQFSQKMQDKNRKINLKNL